MSPSTSTCLTSTNSSVIVRTLLRRFHRQSNHQNQNCCSQLVSSPISVAHTQKENKSLSFNSIKTLSNTKQQFSTSTSKKCLNTPPSSVVDRSLNKHATNISKTHHTLVQIAMPSPAASSSFNLQDAILKKYDAHDIKSCGDLKKDPPREVKIANVESVQDRIAQMIEDGPSQLQLIVDFDRTLTRTVDLSTGKPMGVSWSVIEDSQQLNPDYREACQTLKAKYLPIEQDVEMSVEEKIPHMISWFKKSTELISESKLRREMLREMVRSANVELRDHAVELFKTLNKFEIPILILSAGLGDVVEEMLKERGILFEQNVKVVANFFEFEEESGFVKGIDSKHLIHVFNKNEDAVHDSPYFTELSHRHNVLLMGDSLGDLNMAEGVDNLNAMVKIGYFNWGHESESKLEEYMQGFDVVLVNDQSVDFASAIVHSIVNQHKK